MLAEASTSPFRSRSMGSGALGATSACWRISRQKSSGTVAFSAAWSSAMRSGRLAPGMIAADAGCASENCNAAALIATLCRFAITLIRSTLARISGGAC